LGTEVVQEIIKKALREGRHNLLEPEAKAACLEYGIPTPPFRLSTDAENAVACAEELGYPVVLKIVSPEIAHKTEVGGVVLNLSSGDAVKSAYESITKTIRTSRPDARIFGVLVQKMAPQSTEVIVGSIRDPQFGPTILFGLGGVFVEILKDVAFRITPLEERDAREMIREIKGYPVLTGYRGSPPADQDAIVSVILRASSLVSENTQIEQMDLNPTIVYAHGSMVVDARILLSS
jgi:acyl-CoA synthetase (NDP forming)